MFHRSCGLLLLLFFLASAVALAEEPNKIISNSEDWRDVYSVMQFGVLNQKTSHFLVSTRHATLLPNQIPTSNHIWVVSSKKVPFVVGYESLLKGKGYSVEEFTFDNINLELAQQLKDVRFFAVIDDSYGYNAISVAPYAAVSNSYVLFADRNSIDDIAEFLQDVNPEKVLLYGPLDREVRDSLQKFNPEVINKEGDRFLNNVEIVKKYLEIAPTKQVILTNGEFIEQEIMSGSQPVIFIGTNNVPKAIQDYIGTTPIEVGVLIGNELVGTATSIRRQLGISVFVKFAQGARAPQGSIAQVEALDMFYLPTYALNLEIDRIKYNRATNQLEVTLKNTEQQGAYFTGTYSLTGIDGVQQTLGDTEPQFIDGNEIKTRVYEVQTFPEGRITGDIFIVYGESRASLERELRATLEVDSVTILDECQVQLNGLSLVPSKKTFSIAVQNIGEKDCYTDAELIDIVVAGDEMTIGSDVAILIKPGRERDIRIKVDDFEEADIEDNERVKVRVYYGERETSLVKIAEGTFEVEIKKADYLFYSLLVVIIVLLLVMYRRYRKKESEKSKTSSGKSETI